MFRFFLEIVKIHFCFIRINIYICICKSNFKEFYDLQHGNLDAHEFLEKYNFTHLLVAKDDWLYNRINTTKENYFVLYENTDKGYRLYARNDTFSDNEREKIVNEYTKVVDEAIKKGSK